MIPIIHYAFQHPEQFTFRGFLMFILLPISVVYDTHDLIHPYLITSSYPIYKPDYGDTISTTPNTSFAYSPQHEITPIPNMSY